MPYETLTDRYAVVLNTEKRQDDRRYREQKITAAMKELEGLNTTIQKGYLKDRDKIIVRASLIVRRHKVKRYITWSIPEGEGFLISCTRNDKEITKDELYDGVYVLRTNKTDMTAAELVAAYKQLNRVEMAFRCLKDTLEIRPVYHWKEERVKAHIYICVISYLIHTAIEYLLKNNGIQLGTDAFLKKVNKVKLITLTDEDGKVIARKVTKKIDEKAKDALKIFGIKAFKAKKMYWRK